MTTTVAALRQAVDRIRGVDLKEAQTVWGAGKVLAEALADLDEALLRGEREIERARRQIAGESLSRLESNLETLYRRQSWLKPPNSAIVPPRGYRGPSER